MSILNKDSAKKIAKKLGAEIDKSASAHDIAVIYEGGVEIASFGIRRGRRDLGHDHIPSDIHVRPRQARDLAQCPMSRDEWVQLMMELGLIEKPARD